MDKQKVLRKLPDTKDGKTAIVVLSGGQDSCTCAYLAAQAHDRIIPVCFEYGQNHVSELRSADWICRDLGVRPIIINAKEIFRHQKGCSLIPGAPAENIDIHEEQLEDGTRVPSTFVQGRNAFFLTTAFILALASGAEYIYTGVSQADYSGYPDCREAFIQKMQDALNTGYGSSIQIKTPLMDLSKAETFLLANYLGVLGIIVRRTTTCYRACEDEHGWGNGCGECPACQLRIKGYNEYLEG